MDPLWQKFLDLRIRSWTCVVRENKTLCFLMTLSPWPHKHILLLSDVHFQDIKKLTRWNANVNINGPYISTFDKTKTKSIYFKTVLMERANDSILSLTRYVIAVRMRSRELTDIPTTVGLITGLILLKSATVVPLYTCSSISINSQPPVSLNTLQYLQNQWRNTN